MSKKRIVILFQADLAKQQVGGYEVMRYVKTWNEDGHEVQVLLGPTAYVAADIALLHVGLSVVPESYLNLAMQYRVVLNDKITDIRKSTLSKHLVRPGDGYQGPVIVKSDLNNAGLPEDNAAMRRQRVFDRPEQYPVFSSISEVPPRFLIDPAVVIEKFMPERDGDSYCVRSYTFMGDHGTCFRFKSPNPVLRSGPEVSFERVEPDPAILAQRAELNIDFGRLDYVVHEGQAVLLDVNKTNGRGPDLGAAGQRVHRARGLYKYFVD